LSTDAGNIRGLARAVRLAALSAAAATAAGCAASAPGFGSPVQTLRPVLEIFIFFLLFLFIFRFMRGTRGEGILKGIATILLAGFFFLFWLSKRFDLPHVGLLLHEVLSASVIALMIIFQPELRRGLVRIGENSFVRLFIRSDASVISELVDSVVRLSKKKVGALIAIEREIGLRSYIEGGVKIDAEVKSELIDTIFYPGTALHDGAIVIQGQRIAAAGCLFPLTDNPTISKALGTRHRAGIGLTEETDAVTIIVSEETGQISIGVDGELHRNLDKEQLETMLRRLVVTGDASKAVDVARPGPASLKEKELVR
jgi:diadenylate cyclase